MVRRDEAEFLDFATAVRPQLRRTAYLICHDWDRAADIAQEALIRLYVAPPNRRVEPRGLEPLTPCLQSRCATSCAKAP
jgi:DNA-directed RNA polymerase specialized sigma24 family protein